MEKQDARPDADVVYYPRSDSTTIFTINMHRRALSRPPTGTDLTEDPVATTVSSLSTSRTPVSPSQGGIEDPLETAFRAPQPSLDGAGGDRISYLAGKEYGSPVGNLEPASSITPLMPHKQKARTTPLRIENISLLSQSMEQEQEVFSPLTMVTPMAPPYHRVVARCLSCNGSCAIDVHQTVYVHASGTCTPGPLHLSRADSATASARLESSLTQPRRSGTHRAVHSANDTEFFISPFSGELSHLQINEAPAFGSASRTDWDERKRQQHFQDARLQWRSDAAAQVHVKGMSSRLRLSESQPASQTIAHCVRLGQIRDRMHLKQRSRANSTTKVAPELPMRNSLSLSATHFGGGLAPINTSFLPEGSRRNTGSLESPSLLLSQSLPSEATMIDKGPDWGGTPGSESLSASHHLVRRDGSVDEVERHSSTFSSPQLQRVPFLGEPCVGRPTPVSTYARPGSVAERRGTPKPGGMSGVGSYSAADDAANTHSVGEGSGEDEFDVTQRPEKLTDAMTSSPLRTAAQRRMLAAPAAVAEKGQSVPDELRQYADAVQYAKSHKAGLTLKEILAKGTEDLDEEDDEV